MTPEEKEALKQKVKDRLKGKTSHQMIDEIHLMVHELNEGKL